MKSNNIETTEIIDTVKPLRRPKYISDITIIRKTRLTVDDENKYEPVALDSLTIDNGFIKISLNESIYNNEKLDFVVEKSINLIRNIMQK